MKATALIAAAALLCGTAAFAAEHDSNAARGEESAGAEHQDHGSAGGKMREGMHNLGEKTRHAFHRMGDKLHAKRDHADNAHAMGASGSTVADNSSARQKRMDDAYANWQSKHEGTQNR
jgi:hypothetical protein